MDRRVTPSHPVAPPANIEAGAHGKSAVPRTHRDPAGMRRHILVAAIEEFMCGGFVGTRVDAIARRAETDERMLYYYYGSKEKFFLTVPEHTYFRFKEAGEQVQIKSSDPCGAVIQLVRFVRDFYYKNPEFIRLFNSENLHGARYLETSPHLGELVNPVIEVLQDVVKRGRRAGIFRDDVDVSRLYLTVSALGYYALSNRYTISVVVGRDIASADGHEVFAQLYIRMLLAYLDRPEG